MAPKEKKKRVHLSIADKLELLKKLEAGASVSRVCEIYGVKKQTVSDIRKAKDKLRNYALKFNVDTTKDKKGVIHGRSHMRQPQSETLEEAVFKWYVQQRSVKVNVRGVELMAGARKLADHMGINFKASTVSSTLLSDLVKVLQVVLHKDACLMDSIVIPSRALHQRSPPCRSKDILRDH
ncbi:hypothetical protein Pmani_006826 [Petrolisthes manimaculis]|uniref:HTH psq-type domain-containing protein n=1 Tax=Petrolisthes manimaculis TaxID=1843537 RepID=A0AAE1UG66_9EUCA|nr:hypothetical protein Pmani_006826 [Petrolisthes manimaculis]